MLLYYRPPTSETFAVVPMTRSRRGWYEAVVPAAAVTGHSLHYYVEAQGPSRRVTTTNGQAGSPNLLVLRGGADDNDDPGDSVENKSDDPLVELEAERERTAREAGVHRRHGGDLFVALGIGSGYGWHSAGATRSSGTEIDGGFRGAGTMHLLPELGWQLSDRWALSLQGRHQFVVGHSSAHAALARLWWFAGEGNAQFFATASAGGGQGFSLVAPPSAVLVRRDTIRGGPFLFGPSAGLVYHFAAAFTLGLEARALIGAPDLAGVGEISTVVQTTF